MTATSPLDTLYQHGPLPSCQVEGQHPGRQCGMFRHRWFDDDEDRRRERIAETHNGNAEQRRRSFARRLANDGLDLVDIQGRLHGNVPAAQIVAWAKMDGWYPLIAGQEEE